MYFNVRGEKVSRARYREMLEAAKTRRELIAAGLTSRRDLLKMGLLTAGGMLVAKSGLSARASAYSSQDSTGGSNNLCIPSQQAASPSTRAFVDPLPIMPTATPVATLNPFPTLSPNTGAGESRTRDHQMFNRFITGSKFYNVTQQQISVRQSPDLPLQKIWAFNDGTHVTSPGPTYVSQYGTANLVRNHNALPPVNQNGGFGLPSVTTHLHNGHTPSESDGFPCDFFEIGHFYDQQYPNVLAGFASDHQPNGDINESLSTLWYHDHRVDFTSQNTYKGLLGFYLLFNQFDTGNEETGFRLPSFPQFDVPLVFADKVYDPTTGLLAFDLFNLDGILGDKFLVNGKIQPFFQVKARRYRFRLLDTGPSRFYEFFLTDLNNLGANNQYWVIANDGNLLPAPVKVSSVRIGVAERVDVVIDFRPFAGKTIYLENRLNQINGQGPVITQECGVPEVLGAGQGNLLLKFIVSTDFDDDDSADPSTQTFYSLPDTTATPRITRTFKFDRLNGQWSINGQFMDCNEIRVHIQPNSVEHWLLTNATGDWTHPVHIHEEEHQILTRNRQPVTLAVEHSRKDVTQLRPNERVQLFFRFRDWTGRYPLHCHNVIHEDHAMMLRWEIDPNGGDNTLVP
jgi:FtsP/CotA-like multicopper oxidase with cupredoxin domain